jgi:ATP-dependent NAD(P)H-hydrate dehydratase
MGTESPEIILNQNDVSERQLEDPAIKPVLDLTRKIGTYLFLKGNVDVITDGQRVVCVGVEGSHKRCGGQGDILSGVLATVLWNATNNHTNILDALVLASQLVRRSARIAFTKKQRSLTAPDILKSLPKALIEIIGNYNP